MIKLTFTAQGNDVAVTTDTVQEASEFLAGLLKTETPSSREVGAYVRKTTITKRGRRAGSLCKPWTREESDFVKEQVIAMGDGPRTHSHTMKALSDKIRKTGILKDRTEASIYNKVTEFRSELFKKKRNKKTQSSNTSQVTEVPVRVQSGTISSENFIRGNNYLDLREA